MGYEGCKCHKVFNSPDDKSPRWIAWMDYKVRHHTEEKPAGRTLFIKFVPPECKIEKNLRTLLSKYGEIEKIIYESTKERLASFSKVFPPHKTFMHNDYAFVIFKKKSSLKKIMDLDSEEELTISKDGKITTMLNAIDLEYKNRSVPLDFFDERDAETVKKYSMRKRTEEDALNSMETDEEGWETVTKSFKPMSSKLSNEKALKKRIDKLTKFQHINFYAFQEREKKMKKWQKTAEYWEECEKKIKQVKQARKCFKPL